MIGFDDVLSPTPPSSRMQKTGRMAAVAAGSWELGSIGAAPSRAPGTGFQNAGRQTSTLSGGDLIGTGMDSVGAGRLKVDLTTTLEQFFLGLTIITGGISGLALITLFTGDASWRFLFGALSAFLVSFGLYRMTDNYYIIDLKRKMFLYHFHFAFIEFDSTVAPFSKIVTCTTTSVHKSSKQKNRPTKHWWEYAAVAVLDSGKVIPVTDFSSEALNASNYMAEKLANVFQTKFVQGRPKCKAVIKRDSMGNVIVVQETPSEFWPLLLLLIVLVVALASKFLSGI